MKNLFRLLTFVLLTVALGWPQSQINSFQILRMGKQSTAPANPPINASYVYFDGTNMVCVTSAGASCLASSGGSGTVTSIATTSPIGGGTITGTGTLTCTTCVVASSPGSGIAHFAGSTQTVTSSAIVAADITSGTITGTQLSSSIALPNGATATTQSASDNSTKVATTAYVDAKGSGALVQVETHTAASSAELDFTTCISSTYKTYKIVLRNLVPATNAVSLNMQFSSDGGATYLADSHYTSAAWRFNTGGGAAASVSNANQFRLDTNPGGATIDNTSTDGVTGEYILSNPQSTSLNKKMVGLVTDMASGGSQEGASGTYSWATSGTAANAFRLLFSSGNIASGTATCYGLTP